MGEWVSPISSELITAKTLKLSAPCWGGVDGNTLLWLEGRPLEGGRGVVVQR